jgi:hypothetical protein
MLLLLLLLSGLPRALPQTSLLNAPPCAFGALSLPGRVATSGDCVPAAHAATPPALRVLHGADFAGVFYVARSEPPGGRTAAQLALAGAPDSAPRGSMMGPARASLSPFPPNPSSTPPRAVDNTTGVAVGNASETIYMVTQGTHANAGCCFECVHRAMSRPLLRARVFSLTLSTRRQLAQLRKRRKQQPR